MLPALLTIMLLLSFTQAIAADAAGERPTTFSLNIERNISEWKVSGSEVESRINSAGLTLSKPINDRLVSALHLGYLDLAQPDNPVTDGLGLTGGYLGVTLGTHLYRTEHLGVRLDLGYRYSSVEDSNEETKVNLSWHELSGALKLLFSFDSLQLSVGASRTGLDGDEKESNRQTRSIKLKSEDAYSAGVLFWIEPTGYVGIQARRGAQEVTRLVFGRQF